MITVQETDTKDVDGWKHSLVRLEGELCERQKQTGLEKAGAPCLQGSQVKTLICSCSGKNPGKLL